MNYTEYTGKTVNEAIENGLKELGLTREQADVRILEEGKKKLFGAIKARVEIAPLCEEKTACKVSDNASDGERTVEFLEGLFNLLNVTACTELVAENEKIEINVTAANSTFVIGKHGATLDAIQTLAGAVANTGRDDYKRVVVDCENYRENREATLEKLAENLSQKAIRLGRKIQLEPMNPYERRIIHATLSKIEGVKTESEGKEPNRYIVIIPNNLEDENAPAIEARNDRRDHGNNRGGRNRDPGGAGFQGAEGPLKLPRHLVKIALNMVDEGAAVFGTVVGMDRQTGSLVNQQDMLVFVNDVQFWGGHGQVSIVFPGLVKKFIIDVQLQHITGIQPGIPVNALAVAFDALQADIFLCQRGRQQGNRLREKAVQTLTGIILGNCKFFHLILPIFSSKWRLICSVNSRAGL